MRRISVVPALVLLTPATTAGMGLLDGIEPPALAARLDAPVPATRVALPGPDGAQVALVLPSPLYVMVAEGENRSFLQVDPDAASRIDGRALDVADLAVANVTVGLPDAVARPAWRPVFLDVENRGNETSPSTRVVLDANATLRLPGQEPLRTGERVGEAAIPWLAPGERVRVRIDWGTRNNLGDQTLTARVDPDGKILEWSEADNARVHEERTSGAGGLVL